MEQLLHFLSLKYQNPAVMRGFRFDGYALGFHLVDLAHNTENFGLICRND